MDINMLIQSDRKINASSYRYRCDDCRVVIGYKGVCHTCKEKGANQIMFKDKSNEELLAKYVLLERKWGAVITKEKTAIKIEILNRMSENNNQG